MIKIQKDTHLFKMSPLSDNVTKCESGDVVVFETLDCFSNTLLLESAVFGVDNPKSSNPATGPLYINGASSGDTLKIDILDITVGDIGIFISGAVNKIFDSHLSELKVNRIHVEDDIVNLSAKHRVKSKPMIGVIGVAAIEAISTSLPGIHGGNLDCNDICKGSTVYLPILVDGGLLSIGDLHALMGDGEIGECGLEIEGTVTVRVTVIKNTSISSPRIETEDMLGIIGLGHTLEDACEHASQEMLKHMINVLNMDSHEASKILCLCGNLKICQIVNQVKTVMMKIQKNFLEQY